MQLVRIVNLKTVVHSRLNMMNTIRLLALALCLTACSSNNNTAPTIVPGTVTFTRDASCTGVPASFTFLVDGAIIGNGSLIVGQSLSFSAPAGSHVFNVTELNSSLHFDSVTAVVPSAGTVTYLITCR
jgi:hypothetical protein